MSDITKIEWTDLLCTNVVSAGASQASRSVSEYLGSVAAEGGVLLGIQWWHPRVGEQHADLGCQVEKVSLVGVGLKDYEIGTVVGTRLEVGALAIGHMSWPLPRTQMLSGTRLGSFPTIQSPSCRASLSRSVLSNAKMMPVVGV